MLGWTGRLVLIAATLVVALALAWLVAGSIEVSLSPEAKACELPVEASIPAEDNAYFALAGLHAGDPAADTNQVGRAMLEEYVRAIDQNPAIETYEYPQELKVVGKPRELCQPLVRSCMPTSLGFADRIREFEQENTVLLKRYHALYSYSHFQEMTPPHGSSPAVSYGSSLHSLVLARIALQATQRQQAQALEGLARDTAFWRVLLKDGSLLSKSVGTGRMLSNVQQLSDILSLNTTLTASEQVFVEQILQPLSDVEQDWSPAIRREFCIFGNGSIVAYNNGYRERQSPYADGPAHRIIRLAFRPNHTKNLVHERAKQVLAGDLHHSRHFGDSWWDYAYNPIGRYLVYEFIPDASTFAPYRNRLKDLDGLMRLVRLQWEIRKQNVRAPEVPAFLKAHAVIADNRATGHTVRWDAKRNVLWLARLAARQGDQNVFEAPRE
jgi:hypothetical protein